MNAYSETDQIKEWHKKPNKKAFIGFDEQTQAAVIAVLARENPKEAARFLRQLSSQQRQAAFRNIPREDWCGIAESLVPIKQEIKPSKIPWWSSLRALGNFPLFKVSYVALLVLPWVSRIAEYLKAGGDTYIYIGALYFGDLFLALGNLLYDVFCPPVVKRWASPNDFYVQMLEVTIKQKQCYPDDAWVGTLDHSKTAYLGLAQSKPIARFFCAVLFFLGLLLLSYVLLERSWHVLHPILCTKSD